MPFDGAFSPVHILIVAVVALLVLGPEQLPKIARQAGQGYRELKRVQQHLKTELRDVVSEFDLNETPKPAEPHVDLHQGHATPPTELTGSDTIEP